MVRKIQSLSANWLTLQKTLRKEAAGLCLKQKECTNLQQKASSFSKMLSALGQCCGAEVCYWNSSKHRKLIEQKAKWERFQQLKHMRTSCSCWGRKVRGHDTDRQLQSIRSKSKCNSRVCEWCFCALQFNRQLHFICKVYSTWSVLEKCMD